MIRETTGDILDADVEALVNPVNTAGVMGAGLALQFKLAYPDMYHQYAATCRAGGVRTGRVLVHYAASGRKPWYIIMLPTKEHWRNPSQLEWIDWGLTDLRALIEELNIRSIAIPPLGCGLGGLDWTDVRKLIEDRLGGLDDVDVVLYVSGESKCT